MIDFGVALGSFGVILDVLGPSCVEVDCEKISKDSGEHPWAEATRPGDGNSRFWALLTSNNLD